MRKLSLFLLLSILGLSSYAQNEVDALRYSLMFREGSARSMSMGGAFGALGADMSTFSTNPAGIALFRRNEFLFTPSISSMNTDANYNGTLNSDNRSLLQVSNIGIVGSYTSKNPAWRRFNFGVAYNKLGSFQENIRISGPASNTTLLDVFTTQAQGNFEADLWDLFPFGAALAYETFLINPTDTTGVTTYNNVLREEGFPSSLNQIKTMERTGSMGETVLTGGANYMDKFYVGVTLGFPNIRFREISNYSETSFVINPESQSTSLASWNYQTDLLTTGNGFNFKLGAIYRASNWLRLGAAYHSPSWLNLRDSYETEATARFLNGDVLNGRSPLGDFQYNLRTPSRFMANAAFILGRSGVVSAEYEYVDYAQSSLRSSRTILDDYDFSAENATIQDIYRGTHNVRVGIEGRLGDSFSVRGGLAYQQSPFVDGVTVTDGDLLAYSGGFGYRHESFYIDLAYVLQSNESDHYFYDPAVVEATTISRQRHLIALSLGFRY